MALFKKEKEQEQITIDGILQLIAKLSDEDKSALINRFNETEEEEAEAEKENNNAEVEEAEQQTEEQAEIAEDKPQQEQQEEQAESENAIDESDQEEKEEGNLAEITALRAELTEIKETVKRLADIIESQPFGANPAPPIAADSGKWEGTATKSYFNRR